MRREAILRVSFLSPTEQRNLLAGERNHFV
jgi:hypothetical protein